MDVKVIWDYNTHTHTPHVDSLKINDRSIYNTFNLNVQITRSTHSVTWKGQSERKKDFMAFKRI